MEKIQQTDKFCAGVAGCAPAPSTHLSTNGPPPKN